MDDGTFKQLMRTYGRAHMIMMQIMLQEGVLLKSTFMEEFVQIVNGTMLNGEDAINSDLKQNIVIENGYIDQLLNVINEKIEQSKLRLVRIRDEFSENLETDQNEYIVLISLLQPNSAFSTINEFNSEEKNLIMKWLEEICISSEEGITEFDALNRGDGNISKKRAEEIIDLLVTNKFLKKIDGAVLNFGLRSIAELLPLFAEVSSWEKCASCVKPVLSKKRSFKCTECGSYVHRYCAFGLKNFDDEGFIRCPYKIENGDICGKILEDSLL